MGQGRVSIGQGGANVPTGCSGAAVRGGESDGSKVGGATRFGQVVKMCKSGAGESRRGAACMEEKRDGRVRRGGLDHGVARVRGGGQGELEAGAESAGGWGRGGVGGRGRLCRGKRSYWLFRAGVTRLLVLLLDTPGQQLAVQQKSKRRKKTETPQSLCTRTRLKGQSEVSSRSRWRVTTS